MIDLRSDTVTKPTPEMREAAANADVGDDVYGEDPTVNELETRAAATVGMADALFVPSGTMGNQIAALTHTRAGQSVVVEQASHMYGWEAGGLGWHARLQPTPVDGGASGLYGADQLRAAIIEPELHRAATGLIAIENTHNAAGGVAHGPDEIRPLIDVAAERDIPVHLDGARIFNAAVALECDPAEVAAPADSVMFCLSKGLGAPIGSLLAGSTPFIEDARRHRKRMGGGMRQAGVIAAPGLLALEDRERLDADHRRAQDLANGLSAHDGLSVNDPQTNIVLVDLTRAEYTRDAFLDRLAEDEVLGVGFGPRSIRFCTHRNVDDADIEAVLGVVDGILG